MTQGGQTLTIEGMLETDLAWRPRGGSFAVDVAGKAIHAKLQLEDGVLVQELDGATTRAGGPVDLLISNNVMVHMTPMCALGEARTLTVFPAVQVDVRAPVALELTDPTSTATATPRRFTRVSATMAGELRLELLCDGARLIGVAVPAIGFFAARAGEEGFAAQLAWPERKKPPTPSTLVELPRQVKVEGAVLGCTLLVPKAYAKLKKRGKGKTAPLPAVVFVTGSGAQDRDEDSPGPGGLKLAAFKVLAGRLAEAGVASLRCDDRGVGGSTGSLATATLETFVADARAELAALRAEPAIDAARLGVIGHSEGGQVAPLVAAAEPALRAIALLAAPGRPLDVLVLEQLSAGWKRAGLADAEVVARRARLELVFAMLRAGKTDDLTAEEKASWDNAWWRSHLAADPAAVARTLGKIAVLIAQGGRDVQVRLADSEALNEAFLAAGNPQVRYEIYPELNHLFAFTERGDIADYFDPDAQLDEGFVADVVEFLSRAL
jgi:pimeloyl-ACP methyl ester carboxylesterase